MNHATDGTQIDEPVQLLPAPASEPPNHAPVRCQRERDKQNEA